ncbi:hypothetical protein U9M48_033576 [Paspalum notatum var. saurae]|uniref:DUF8040 domain-containing protein n=1 Tax=Paspalum notatum var. saurae TaxID=547442 RepID=A0AAQ3UAZ4_PASNO
MQSIVNKRHLWDEKQWVELNLHDSDRCYNNFRMQPDAFLQLHQLLVTNHGLQSTQQFESIEALAMFLWACGSGQSFRQIQDRFERSLDSICRKMGNVANVMLAPKDPNYTQVHPRLLRYAPYFDGCIGALDGTHIPARINHDSRLDFINRKGRTSFNVLGIVDMDMRFTYVGAGRAILVMTWQKKTLHAKLPTSTFRYEIIQVMLYTKLW